MLLATLVLVLAGAATGCREAEHVWKRTKPIEVEDYGPVTTEEEAIAATWRYMAAQFPALLQQEQIEADTTIDGVVHYGQIPRAGGTIEKHEKPYVTDDASDSSLWFVEWTTNGGSSMINSAQFTVDKATGHVEIVMQL